MPGKSTPAAAAASQNTTTKPNTTQAPRRPTRSKNQAPPRFPIGWEAGHGATTGPLAMASNAAATAALGTAFDLPTLWPAAVAAAGVLSHGLIAPLRRGAVWSTIAARVTGWAFAGTWCSAVIASDPRHWTGTGWGWAAGTLAAGTMLVGGMAVEADLREEAADEDARAEVRRQINGARWAIAKEWIARIKAVTGVQVQAVGLTQRPDGTGFALEIALPEGSPASKLAGYNVALAEAARLPAGCLVQIGPTAVQGHVLIDVDTVSTADQVHTYGDDFSRRSVLDGLPWFVNRNGKPINVFVRESCALILGPMGAGKTTLFDAILAGFCRCDDVLTWVIDLGKEGDAARPFLAPWLESTGVLSPPPNQDRLPAGIKPGVDWVASTPEQALAMLKAAETVAKWRLGAYAELMRRADTKLLPVSPRIPFIEIVVDEGVEMLSYAGKDPIKKQLGPQLIRLMETTRGMGIRLVLTAVDGNNAALTDSRIRKYSNIRIALTATDVECAGAAKLFGSLRGLDVTQLTAPGSGVAGAKIPVGGFDPQPIRTVRTAPSFARTAVAATNAWRAVLEPQAAHLLGAAYARRWEREQCGWLFGDSTPHPADQPGPAADGTPPPLHWRHSRTDAPATNTGPAAEPSGYKPLRWRHTRDNGQADNHSPAEGDAESPLSAADEHAIAEFQRILGMVPETTEPDQVKAQQDPAGPEAGPAAWRGQVIEILRQAGPDAWMSTRAIREALAAQGLELGRQIVSEALAGMARKKHIRTRGTGPTTEYSAQPR